MYPTCCSHGFIILHYNCNVVIFRSETSLHKTVKLMQMNVEESLVFGVGEEIPGGGAQVQLAGQRNRR